MSSWVGLGLMSGTSLDGVDMAACRFTETAEGWEYAVLAAGTLAWDETWYARLACLPEQNAVAYARTHTYLGRYLGQQAAQFIQQHGLTPDFVAAHGQTIFHQPQKNFTAQIGDGETMAAFLPCPVVTNFRAKDVALGGQGAPLVPFGEKHLFRGYDLFLNLGGIANLSYGQRAFDVCACNMALNHLSRLLEPPLPYDPSGQIAASGSVLPELLEALNALPFFRQPPPKSLGAEWFEAECMPLLQQTAAPLPDIMHTCAQHIAMQVAAACTRLGVRDTRMLVTGGGAHHRFLMHCLRTELAPAGIIPVADDPLLVDFKEAIIFAFLGLMTLLGRTNTLTEVTGAQVPVCGGSIHLPPGGGYSLLRTQ